jgi:hypothetical protein
MFPKRSERIADKDASGVPAPPVTLLIAKPEKKRYIAHGWGE